MNGMRLGKEFRVYFQLDANRRIRGFVEAHEIWGGKDFSRVKVVLDRQATITPRDGSSWWVRLVGTTKDRKIVFVLPIEPDEVRARREWEKKLKEREEAEARAADAAARELSSLDPALVAEVESVIKAICAGPTRPAPTPPTKPEMPGPATLGEWQDYTICFSPGEDAPFSFRAEYRQTTVRGALSEGIDVTLRFRTAGELIEALRARGAPEDVVANILARATQVEATWRDYEAALAAYKTAQASYEAERKAWLAEGHNRVVDLHRRGWLQVEAYGGRDWLFAATVHGDILPILSWEKLKMALR